MPSEDSFLAGKVGAHMTKGIQGDGLSDKYVLLLGALKHVTAYSLESWHDDSGGPRNGTKYNRMGFGFNLTRHDLAETYLEQYRIAIAESNALGMMCSCECTARRLALHVIESLRARLCKEIALISLQHLSLTCSCCSPPPMHRRCGEWDSELRERQATGHMGTRLSRLRGQRGQ